MKIGIFGGSFDPIHHGHLIIADRFIEQMDLDKCYIVPTKVSPFKQDSYLNPKANDEDRIKMIELAIETNDRLYIDTFEINNERVSYSIDTINYFADKYPKELNNLFFLIGGDQAVSFHKWKAYQEIISKVQLCIATRNDNTDSNHNLYFTKHLNPMSIKPIVLSTPLLEISSSEIRERINFGMTIKYLLPEAVEKYIFQNSIYS